MESYKLTYFNLRGMGESIRMLFKYAKVSFEEVQVDAKNWYNVKKDFKWQQLPFLEHNGKCLTQSAAIGNFLERKFNLVPTDSWDKAKCDEVVGALYDLKIYFEPLFRAKFLGNTEKAEHMKQVLIATVVPLFLNNLENLLVVQKASGKHETDLILGGNKPTWADFCLATFNEMWASILDDSNLLNDYPFLKRQQQAVYALPAVAEWIETRPETFL